VNSANQAIGTLPGPRNTKHENQMNLVKLNTLKNGEFFKRIIGGKVSRETYTREDYDRQYKRFICAKHSDLWGDWVMLKGSTLVNTDFEY
jgi:hypothetical protein